MHYIISAADHGLYMNNHNSNLCSLVFFAFQSIVQHLSIVSLSLQSARRRERGLITLLILDHRPDDKCIPEA